MRKHIQFVCSLALVLCCHQGRAAELQIVKYAQNGNRLAYEVELLQRALDLTQEEYGPARLQHHEFKPSVVLFEQALAKGVFDVAFLPSSTKRENRIQAVKIPLTQGLMSYRLLVVRKDRVKKFENIKTIEGIKARLIGGVGLRWQTLQMFTQNNMLMRTGFSERELYGMLASGGIDYFPRGIHEIMWESNAYSEAFKHLTVSPDVALFYLIPEYYFIRHGAPELAERIEKGLLKALSDGSFKSIFIKHFQDDIEMFNELKVKKIIFVDNPDITLSTPMKFHWWLEQLPTGTQQ